MKTKWLFMGALIVGLQFTASARAGDDLVVHEWGTFTSVQGADGVQLEWNPLIKTDLPKFVYNTAGNRGGLLTIDSLLKSSIPSFIRMETPVVYFYSDIERSVDVRVDFPQGRITEWYPRATLVGPYPATNKTEAATAAKSFIEWRNVRVLPPHTKEVSADTLIRDVKDQRNHYYEARAVDANFLRVNGLGQPEYERDLFYRGIGSFRAPLTVTMMGKEDQLVLTTTNREPLTDLFVLTVRDGLARYEYLRSVEAGKQAAVRLNAKKFAPLSDVKPAIMAQMVQVLVRQGLFEKEAQAMVQTWKDQWFAEEGLRVLYLLPPGWTEETLPLSISPDPTKSVRVMVGRAEVITPTMEWTLLKEIVRYGTGDSTARAEAVAAVKHSKLGRFIEPATRKVLGAKPNAEFADAAWKLAQAASDGAVAIPDAKVASAFSPDWLLEKAPKN